MRKFKQNQFGGVTILLVILVGVAVMVATASLAYSINSKKEASVAAHAQTNAQMMAWAGTSAFYEYIKAKGATSLDDFKALNATSVTLKNSGGQEVIAKNISITGACAADGDLCEISADISAKNAASKAANTVNVRYKMRVQDGTVVPVAKFKASFGGDVLVDGKIIAEAANTDAEITVKGGDLWLNAGAQVNNFANLTFNVEGNVIIHCTASNCGNVGKMDINAGGYIYITDTGFGHFGNLNAKDYIRISGTTANNLNAVGYVALVAGAHADDIKAGGDVDLAGGIGALASSAKNIQSNGNVVMNNGSSAQNISAAGNINMVGGLGALVVTAGDLSANGNVDLRGATVKNIQARGNVALADGAKSKNIKSNGNTTLTISGTKVDGNVETLGYIYMSTDAVVTGDGTARGDNKTTQGSSIYMISGAKILGSVYAKGSVRLITPFTTGQVYATDKVMNGIGTKTFLGGAAGWQDYSSTATTKTNQLSEVPLVSSVDTQVIKDAVDGKFDFNNNVDVRVYKNEANYIFTKVNKITRVYLNKLKDPATGNIYSYKMDSTDSTFKQYEKIAGVDTLVGDGGGFYLGKYTLGGTQKYVGAICKSVANGSCTSDIVAYLPRVSAEDQPFGTALETLNYTTTGDGFWQVKNFFQNSTIDNATIAPGIFYFEGELRIHGNPNIQSDPTSKAYTITFFAEGDISALVVSPRIYSPYNILRVKSDASVICNRNLAQANGTIYTSAPSTTPTSSGFKYLVPTNLCKNDTQFAYNMDRDPATNQRTIVVIDWKNVPKLDLGYVALMSNKVVRLGTCSQIFGDVLARERIEVTGACGATSEQQVITGNITTQNASGSGYDNLLPAGGKWVLPKEEFSGVKGPGSGGGGGGTGITVDSSSIEMTWAKSL